MPEESGKFAEKIGVFAAPGAQVNIGTQIIESQKQLNLIKYHIPYRGSVHFVGRETELTMLHQQLQRGDYVAIAGMGGVGKTELATQYARRYQQDYSGIAWFNDRETNLAATVLEFFVKFGFEIPQEQGGRLLSLKEQVAWCWAQYPQSNLPILIIFDDVTNLANLREVVPQDHRFCVLVTTRLRILDPNFIQAIPLDVLSPQKEPGKAVELLKGLLGNRDRRVENQPTAATAICECLEYLPLGIELVGGYLVRDPDLALDMMLKWLQERKLAEAALQNRETLTATQLGVKAAFALTWAELDPLAQQLGRFLSLFAPQLILWDVVIWVAINSQNIEQTEITAPHPETLNASEEGSENAALLGWNEEELNTAKKQLYERNLLQQVEDSDGYYKIHALVRWFLQEQLAGAGEMKSVLEKTFANAMIAVAQTVPQSPTSEDIELIKDVVPHLEDLGQRLIAEVKQVTENQINYPASVPQDKVLWAFVGVGRFYAGQGLYQLAEPWYEECVNVCQVLFAGDHPDVAFSLNNLAVLYLRQGRYSKAETLFIDSLAMYKRLFAGDHPNVAFSLNNLANLYLSQGRYSKAELLFIECLAMRKRLFAGDHPDVATSLNNLASLYKSQGRYSEAETLHIQALAITKRLFASDHPNVAFSLNNLASLYRSQGRYSEAEPLFIDALAMRKRLFASDHPNVATSLNNLAGLYLIQRKYSEAEPLYIQALAMRKRLFAGDHPDVATSLDNLASLYKSQQKYSEAEPLHIQALAMRKRLFAGDHPDIATSLNNLALLYDKHGKYSEAEPLYVQALAMCQRVLGVNHPTTVTIRENLTILQRQLTLVGIWKRRLRQVLQILLAIVIFPFYLLWRLAKRIIQFVVRNS
ncbi:MULTISPECIES: tetratricopeptide repeat protein [unclassified Tolypothrix]|uniref:tetratricopeptide repeat protein n=1 Tax=unclassified Tolypothrix TaxID=2649714 RepID=UPI0005EAB3D6|nr:MULTISPECIES: tetratricopeptide repeat protein [unclassified Tolypothrix]BAY94450.1 putative kinesin light chain [Microchaete diplosiphon NIES-3275]EKF02842.1 tetratricopeptide repeat protein [Tolypothrix sp. PCC 7601]MBE9087362.1 ATP-binding protein [Tolypothrix sp. LEGE 11397]UYD28160.1 ATP-binding protein [Tolypothrix sp. PCC 7712]UYD35964.1 ATP-binding protein [Tolypothrix sp. PCC 7601]